MGSAEAAELAKLAETTYRDVNIGLANQFAVFADRVGIDIERVIDACNSQPYSHIHRPGIAVGGHCIPVYPRLYLSTDPDATIVRKAREFNETMPGYAVDRLSGILGPLGGLRVVVFGASYHGGVKKTVRGCSPSSSSSIIVRAGLLPTGSREAAATGLARTATGLARTMRGPFCMPPLARGTARTAE